MNMLLIRHGQAVANAEGRLQGQFDPPLTDLGWTQAQALARRLVCEGWAAATNLYERSRACRRNGRDSVGRPVRAGGL